jgi:hypothetical protein
MRKAAVILLAVVVLSGSLVFFKNQIGKALVTSGFEKLTGTPMKIGEFRLSLLQPMVSAKEVEIYNPEGFPGGDKVMARIPAFYFAFDLGQFFRGSLHIRSFALDLERIVVVRNAGGAVNLESLRALQPRGGGKQPSMTIDEAEIGLGKVEYRDYQLGSPLTRELDVNFRRKFANVTDPSALVKAVVTQALQAAGLSAVTKELENKVNKQLEKFKGLGNFSLP